MKDNKEKVTKSSCFENVKLNKIQIHNRVN